MFVYVYIHTYIHTHVCAHTHTHFNPSGFRITYHAAVHNQWTLLKIEKDGKVDGGIVIQVENEIHENASRRHQVWRTRRDLPSKDPNYFARIISSSCLSPIACLEVTLKYSCFALISLQSTYTVWPAPTHLFLMFSASMRHPTFIISKMT